MSKAIAKRQFDYAWSLYKKGLRGHILQNKVKTFAIENNLPNSFIPPMHCIAIYVRNNTSVGSIDALKGLLMAFEFASNKKLEHHVLKICAYRADLIKSFNRPVDKSILAKAMDILNIKREVGETLLSKSNPATSFIKNKARFFHQDSRLQSNQFMRSVTNLLNTPVIELMDISKTEIDIALTTFEGMIFSQLSLTKDDCSRLETYYILPDDQLDIVLRLSIGYLRVMLPGSHFNRIMNSVILCLKTVLKKNALLIRVNEKLNGDKNFYNADFISLFKELPITSSIIPEALLERLHKFNIYKWGQIINLAESASLDDDIVNSIDLLLVINELNPYIDEIQDIVKTMRSTLGLSSLTAISRNWISSRSNRKRDADVYCERMGWDGYEPRTLETIGQKYGLTRERVRQIENNYYLKLNHVNAKSQIYLLWLVTDALFYYFGGMATLSEIITKFQLLLGSNMSFSVSGFNNLLKFAAPDLFAVKWLADECFAYPKIFICGNCLEVERKLLDIISEHKKIHIEEAAAAISKECAECLHKKTWYLFSKSFVAYLISTRPNLRKCVRIKNDTLFDLENWSFINKRILPIAENILKTYKNSMHFTEIYEHLKKLGLSVTERSVHASLSRSENVILWDRGTFIHKEYVPFPYGLIRQIEQWIASNLQFDIPFISVNGAFTAFKEHCLAANIPSESALYSCLKLSGDSLFSYPHYPYIYLTAKYSEKLPVTNAIEDFIKNADGDVSQAELKHYAFEKLRIKNYVLSQLITRIPDIFRTKNGYIHVENIDLNFDTFNEIIQYIKRIIFKSKHISVKKVFYDKQLTCKLVGINSPELLYSVLQKYFNNEFEIGNYPQILLSREDVKSKRGIIPNICDYIRKKKSFCTRQELYNHFVNDLGYSEQLIYLAGMEPDIYRYLDHCLVHRDTLEWNQQKQVEIEKLASNCYRDDIKAGNYYSMVATLVELSELPQLGNDLYWTEPLIADILSKNKQFRILGNTRNVYVPIPNSFHIESLEDLVYEILAHDNNGAENLDIFSEKLVDLGIIKHRITPSMLGAKGRILIVGQEIMLADLHKNA